MVPVKKEFSKNVDQNFLKRFNVFGQIIVQQRKTAFLLVKQRRKVDGTRVNFRIKEYLHLQDSAFEERPFNGDRDETAGRSVSERVADRLLKFAANSR